MYTRDENKNNKQGGRNTWRRSGSHVHTEIPLAVLLPLRPQPLALLRRDPLLVADGAPPAATSPSAAAAAAVPRVPRPGRVGGTLVVVRIVVLRSTAAAKQEVTHV